MSFRRPTAAGIASNQGLLDVLTGLYDRIAKPGGGNLTQFITTVVTAPGGPLPSLTINTTAPLTGGGPLSSSLTLALSIDGTLNVSAGALGIADHGVSYVKIQQESATTLLGNPTGSLGNVQEVSLGPGLGFVNFGGGPVLTNTSPLSGLTATPPLQISGTVISFPGAIYSGGPGSQNLGSLTSGLLKQSVSGGQATLAIAVAGTDYQTPLTFSTGLTNSSGTVTANLSTGVSGGQLVIGGTTSGGLGIISNTSHNSTIGFGNGSSIGVMDEATGKQSWGQVTVDAKAHFVLSNDTTPTTIASWDGRHVLLGISGSGGAGIGFSHTSGTGGNLLFLNPGVTWETASVYAQAFQLFTGGSNTLALTVDGTQNANITGCLAVQTPSGSVPTNTSLIVTADNNNNRDRAQFFVGGGALGPTGTGDSTLFDLAPSNTTVQAGVTGGTYATQRIRSLIYSSAAVTSPVRLASLYIDDAPTAGTNISGTTLSYALYVASGGAQFNGVLGVSGNFQCGATASAKVLTIAGSGGVALSADGNASTFAAFGVTAVARQTGGAASAGATYTATEQGMINRMYTALRNYGWLT